MSSADNILPCKKCSSEARIAYWEVAEDDEGKYTFEMYFVKCCNEDCDNWYLPDKLYYTEQDAIDAWNNMEDEK